MSGVVKVGVVNVAQSKILTTGQGQIVELYDREGKGKGKTTN